MFGIRGVPAINLLGLVPIKFRANGHLMPFISISVDLLYKDTLLIYLTGYANGLPRTAKVKKKIVNMPVLILN